MHFLRSVTAGLIALAACSEEVGPPAVEWTPGTVLPSSVTAPRGHADIRGLIHAHSVYSHDGCDYEPVKMGERDPVCFEDFRRGLCQSRHDFVMLTDHPSDYADNPYPEVLLYRADRDDVLIRRNGRDAANRITCGDGRTVLINAGTESGELMAVGIEGHIDLAIRRATLGTKDPASIAILNSHGAAVLVQHTEERSVSEIVDNPVDGFEIFNLHAAAVRGAAWALELFVLMDLGEGLPHSDLVLLGMLKLDGRYMERWANIVETGARRTGVMGTDCHRNTFPRLLPDGERVDSYRRMMIAFSNHLLVTTEPDGAWDDSHLKDAIRAGRLYGVFEALGYAEGFDFRAESSGGVTEMGGEVTAAESPVLFAAMPSVRESVAPITRTLRLLRARTDGWDEVATATGDLTFPVAAPGVYRVEVDIATTHLTAHLGEMVDTVGDTMFPWVLSNPIYIR